MQVRIIDTETTDSDPKTAQVIELAWLAMPENLLQLPQTSVHHCESFNARFCPDQPIKYGAMATHHILMSDLGDCLPSSAVKDSWQDPGVDYAIGHNIDFDAEVLGGLPGVKRICTLALSRMLLPELDSHKQGAVLYYFACLGQWAETARLAQREAHSALADVKMCAYVLNHLVALATATGYKVENWEDLYQLSELARIPTVMGFGKYKGTPINQVDRGYVRWYRQQADTDPYYLEAFCRAGY